MDGKIILKKVMIIGLGLIGGSLAKALRQAIPDLHITGVGDNKKFLMQSKDEGTLTDWYLELPDEIEEEVIFLCTPIEVSLEFCEKLVRISSPSVIITDVCSTKTEIVEYFTQKEIELGRRIRFIGGHPMAGSEKSGYLASNVYLFENAYYIISPLKSTQDDDLKLIKNIIGLIGAIPFILDAREHDVALARISHLPQVVAAALVNTAFMKETNEGYLKLLAAGGFKDITRIASGNPQLWETICSSNKANLASAIDDIIRILSDFKENLVGDSSQMEKYFTSARDYRSSFRDGIATISNMMYELNVDVADKPGAIAEISTQLYNAGINIKNIYICGNRDNEGGQLRLVFSSKNDIELATKLLSLNGKI